MVMVDRFREYGGKGPTMRYFRDKYPQKRVYEMMVETVDSTVFASHRRVVMVGDSEEVARLLGGGFDFIFLDGDHFYEGVKKDVEGYYPLVRQGGLLMGHDYGGKGDQKGRFGVQRAVDDFAEAHSHKVVVEKHQVWWFRKN
jgi:predicted O-methyltransferase YrrM